jgi:DNA polymerase I-like protein with 3'-5' exonuclease and polymerase domains
MLINADAKALEWFGAVFLSGDKVGYDEIRRGVDQHTLNQEAFGLPSRLIAKIFVFRLIYGGGAYSYANDADFIGVSNKEAYWQGVIDAFYKKYDGIGEWHKKLEYEAMASGHVRIPTGRTFSFAQDDRGRWPRTQILNYPVQGFGADLMVLARVLLWNRMEHLRDRIKWVCTVHDSIVWDVPDELVDEVVGLIFESWKDIPAEFERRFKVKLDLPMNVEVLVGPDWKNMEERKAA